MFSEELRRLGQLTRITALLSTHHVFRLGVRLASRKLGNQLDERIGQIASRRALEALDLQVETEGLEQVEGLQRYCVVSNHASYLDWALLMAYFPAPLRFVAKRELIWLPAVGAFLRHHGVLIDRSRGDDAKTAIKKAARDESPWPIVIFPEGTRSSDGKIAPFKKGGLRMLADAGLALLPTCLAGTYEALPRDGRAVKGGLTLKLSLGQPVRPTELGSIDEAIDEVERRVHELHAAATAGRSSPAA
jgi:1-acyl-sn-glycerol-3-phosphate acyltransferase